MSQNEGVPCASKVLEPLICGIHRGRPVSTRCHRLEERRPVRHTLGDDARPRASMERRRLQFGIAEVEPQVVDQTVLQQWRNRG